jgi:hypothetical protein
MHRHMDHHLNEVVFIKCNDDSCCNKFWCAAAKDFLGQEIKFPSPSESIVYKGHYNTFLQEAANENKRFGDAGQPNAEEKALGSCQTCPSFSFKSKTERDRHQSLFHRRQKPTSGKEVQLLYCQVEACGKSFKSQSSLSRHQTSEKHRARATNLPTTSKPKKAQQSSITDMLRRINSKNAQEKSKVEQPCASNECGVDSTIAKRFQWVQCDNCDEWYHDYCIGLEHYTDDALDELEFVCQGCESPM